MLLVVLEVRWQVQQQQQQQGLATPKQLLHRQLAVGCWQQQQQRGLKAPGTALHLLGLIAASLVGFMVRLVAGFRAQRAASMARGVF